MPATQTSEPTVGHKSPMKEVVSKMKKGARRVRRSMSHMHLSIGGGSHRRHASAGDIDAITGTTCSPPPTTTTTTTITTIVPPHYSHSHLESASEHEYSSSESSESVLSMSANPTEVEAPEKPQPLVGAEPETEVAASQVFTEVSAEPEVPDPFLIDDEDDERSSDDGRVAAESVAAEAPVSVLVPDVNKDVPPPPPLDSDPEEDEAPDLYLPGLILPTMFLPIPNTDPLTTLLTKYIYPPDKRPFRDSSGEWQNSNFNTLVMTNSWRALAKMARDRLVTTNPEDLALILELWYLRLACLARLRLFNQTSAECTNLFSVINGIAPQSARDWVYERLLPFELEVMQTRLSYWAGDHMSYIDALNAVLAKCRVRSRKCANDPTNMSMWKERGARIALILASELMEMKDFGAATKLLEPLCNQPEGASASPALRSTVARIYLQAGQIGRAKKHFDIVAADESVSQSVKDMNSALMATANGEWEGADAILRGILQTDEDNYAAVNNLSVALLGQGKLKEGIAVLEKALKASPSSVVVAEPFLFNLSTLYELRSATATEKKKDLLVDVAQWSGDGLRTTCLKMPTN